MALGNRLAPRARSGRFPLLQVALILAFLTTLHAPAVVFCAITLLPTLIATIADNSAGKYCGLTVGGLNVAAAAPYLSERWQAHHWAPTTSEAIAIFADKGALLAIFGGSLLGWVLYIVIPPLWEVGVNVTTYHRMAALRAKQKELIELWGEKVGQNDPDVDG